jgi:hypothetical protein
MGLNGDLGVAAKSSAVRICVCACVRIVTFFPLVVFEAMPQLRSPPFESVRVCNIYVFIFYFWGVCLSFLRRCCSSDPHRSNACEYVDVVRMSAYLVLLSCFVSLVNFVHKHTQRERAQTHTPTHTHRLPKSLSTINPCTHCPHRLPPHRIPQAKELLACLVLMCCRRAEEWIRHGDSDF